MAEPAPLISGLLFRQSTFLKTWRRNFYELRGEFLIERDEDNKKETARIRLTEQTRASRVKKTSKPFAFTVTTPMSGRALVLAADDEATADAWIARLNNEKPTTAPAPKPPTVDDFQILTVLGRGTYGKVSLVRHKESRQLFAMKAMSKALLAEDGNIEQIVTEKNVLMENRHPFLVSAYFSFQTDTKVFIVCDYVPGGDLFTRLRQEVHFTEERTRFIAAEIVEAIEYLHGKGVMYRDLKPENVLFDEDGHVKITDFGYTKKLKKPDGTASSFCGTPDYMAPEMLDGGSYSKSVDWWSLGCVIYEMLVGISPFYNKNVRETYHAIAHEPVKFPESVSAVATDLIFKLLAKNPEERLGHGPNDAEEIKCHRFFKGVDWQDVYDKKIPAMWKPVMRSETDTSMFDREFTREPAVVSYEPPVAIPSESASLLQNFTYMNEGEDEETCIPDDD